MAFHVDLNTQGIHSYKTALSKWQTTVPWRNAKDSKVKPLDKRGKKHMAIRPLNDESIALSLYGTDVVIYHPDDTITLTPYSSISTDKFANHFTPSGICTYFNDSLGYLVRLKTGLSSEEEPWGTWHWFKFSGAARFKRTEISESGETLWAIDERTTTQVPFRRYKIDRKRAKEASQKYNLKGFTDWFNAIREMGGLKGHRKENFFWNDGDVAAILLGDREDKWREFLKHVWDYEAVKKFKELIYRVEKVGYVEEVMTLTSWEEWRAVSQSASRNRFYVNHI